MPETLKTTEHYEHLNSNRLDVGIGEARNSGEISNHPNPIDEILRAAREATERPGSLNCNATKENADEPPIFESAEAEARAFLDPEEFASWNAWNDFKDNLIEVSSGPSAFADFKNKKLTAGALVMQLSRPHQRRPKKDGPAICGGRLWNDADAVGKGKNLTNANIADISLLIFEVDSGQTALEATRCLLERGINHLVTSTFNDGTASRNIEHDALLQHMAEHKREGEPTTEDVRAYMREKGRVTEALADSVQGEITLGANEKNRPAWIFQTAPCPKFRIYVFLATAFPIFDPGKIGRNDNLFSAFYNALADDLGILHDSTGANVARLQYLPSVRVNGPEPYSWFVPGYPYDWKPLADKVRVALEKGPKKTRTKGGKAHQHRAKASDFKTKNLYRFGVSCSQYFAVEEFAATILEDRGSSNSGGCCFACPNENGEVTGRPHTTPGGTAFWCCNGWNRTDGGEGFIIHCSTQGCTEHFENDRIRFLDTLCAGAGIDDAERLLEFTSDVEQAREAYDAWERFQTDNDGRLYKNQHNIRVALRRLGVSVSYNEFDGKIYVDGLDGFGPYLDDAGADHIWLTIDREFRFRPTKDFCRTVLNNEARLNSVHPVRDYLDRLVWDGVPRVEAWLTDYLGAEDTPFHREIGPIFLVAAVRRIRRPGVKFDEMIVLEGPQGGGKSSALSILAVKSDWFTDALPINANPKVTIEQTRGRWIVEIAEMAGGRKAEIASVKAFMSRQDDSARPAYGRLTEHVPRSFVCAITNNETKYLRDLTGNRRFWPVAVGEIELEALKRDRDQLWAEAAVLEEQGKSIRLPRELWPVAAGIQEARHVENPYESLLNEKLGDLSGKISAENVYQLTEVGAPQRNQSFLELVGKAMSDLGWEKKKIRFKHRTLTGFRKGDAEDAQLPTIEAVWKADQRCHVVETVGEKPPSDGLRGLCER